MRIGALIVGTASLFAASAFGQAPEMGDQRTQATDMIVRYCLAAPEISDLDNPTEHCSCGARLMVARLDDRQLTVFTRLFAHFPDRTAARAEAERMIAEEGYTQAEIEAMGSILARPERIVEKCEPS